MMFRERPGEEVVSLRSRGVAFLGRSSMAEAYAMGGMEEM